MREMRLGGPMSFRLKKPDFVVARYGLFAAFEILDLDLT
jgi:hypothetical protein